MKTIKLHHSADPTVYITIGYTTDASGNVTTATRLLGGSGNIEKQNQIIWQHIEASAKQSGGLGSLKIAIQQKLNTVNTKTIQPIITPTMQKEQPYVFSTECRHDVFYYSELKGETLIMRLHFTLFDNGEIVPYQSKMRYGYCFDNGDIEFVERALNRLELEDFLSSNEVNAENHDTFLLQQIEVYKATLPFLKHAVTRF